jgi:hypothetical protein
LIGVGLLLLQTRFLILESALAYKLKNGALPERIMFFRDGVGEGQLKFVFETELKGIKVSYSFIL